MNEKAREGDKLTLKRLCSNVWYILKFGLEADRKAMIRFYGMYLVGYVVYSLYTGLFLKYFIECLQKKEISIETTIIYVVIGIALVVVSQICEILGNNMGTVDFLKITGKLQKKFIEKTAKIDLICYDHKEYFDDFVIAASQSEEMLFTGLVATADMMGQFAGILTVGTVILTINPVIAIFPIAGFLVNMVTRFKITEHEYNYEMEYKRIMRKADYSKRVFYQPEYAKEIKLSKIGEPLREQLDEAISEVEDKARKIGIKIAVLSLINWISVFTFLSNFCVNVYLGYQSLVRRKIALGDVAALNDSQGTVRNFLDGLNYAVVKFQKVGQFAERFRRFMDYEIQIEKDEKQKEVPKGKNALKIEDMSFRYEGADHDTLKHVTMTVRPGEKVAIVGENGAGKTTFVKLLMRLYDVTGGKITYGDINIKDFSVREYRDMIGAVFQDYQIYGATLAENVLMNHYEEKDENRVKEALKMADFWKKLEKLPNGIDTEMTREFSDDGTMLSGGEAQKVAIARMFAKSGELAIAILDEPSSALDPRAEYTLNKNMIENAGDAAVIFISHRLSTTRDADRIYMFQNGEIIEEGSHEELMQLDGEYAKMFEKQAHYYQDILPEESFA